MRTSSSGAFIWTIAAVARLRPSLERRAPSRTASPGHPLPMLASISAGTFEDECLQRGRVDGIALMEIDGTYRLAVQTRVEQPLGIPQLGTLWKRQPHRVLEGLADADDAVVGPDGHPLGAGGLLPLHLFDYARVGAPDESPQLAQSLTPPASRPADYVIYLLGRGCVAHFDALLRILSTQRTEGLSSLSLRWMQPSQQHGRRFASNSSGGNRWMCWLRETLGWQSGRVSNPPGLYVPLRGRSPWSSSIAHRSLDAVEGSLEVGAAPGARLIGDLVRDDAGQRAEIVLSSRYLDQPSDVAGAILEALVSGIERLDPPQRLEFGR